MKTNRTCPMKIPADKLMIIAAAIWMIAGVNIALIGIGAAKNIAAWWLPLAAIAVCALFYLGMFSKLTGKHVARIRGYGSQRKGAWHFFDAKGYIIMAIMMSGGIALRVFGILPEWFIAFFYTGLGVALAAAGAAFIPAYFKTKRAAAENSLG